MTTIKSFTDLEQSKILEKILPPESADSVIVTFGTREGTETVVMPNKTLDIIRDPFSDIRETVHCWSLAALLGVLPNSTDVVKDKADTENEKYMCTVGVKYDIISTFGNNPVDACYEAILKLNKLGLI